MSLGLWLVEFLGLLQWAAKFVAMVFVFDWRCCVFVLCLRSLAIVVPSFILPGGISVGSVNPVVHRVTWALYSFLSSLGNPEERY